MPSEFQGPYSEHIYELPQAEKLESTTGTSMPQRRKIDPMGMMGKIFAGIGATLVVIGVLVASLLGYFGSRGFGFSFAILAGVWGTGLLFVLVGLILLLFFRNVRSAIVVDRYFMALAHQDYLAAFHYLDAEIMAPHNELDAQTWFIQQAQAHDERGEISDYALRGFKLNPRSARYMIKVRRGTVSYIVFLFLAKEDDTWQITGFNRF